MEICSKITSGEWKEARNATCLSRTPYASFTNKSGKPSGNFRQSMSPSSTAEPSTSSSAIFCASAFISGAKNKTGYLLPLSKRCSAPGRAEERTSRSHPSKPPAPATRKDAFPVFAILPPSFERAAGAADASTSRLTSCTGTETGNSWGHSASAPATFVSRALFTCSPSFSNPKEARRDVGLTAAAASSAAAAERSTMASALETGFRLIHRAAVRTRLAGRAAVTRALALHEPDPRLRTPPMARSRTAAVASAVAKLAMVHFAITRRASPPGWRDPLGRDRRRPARRRLARARVARRPPASRNLK